MALQAKTVTLTGSPQRRQVLLDLTPGRQRPSTGPFQGTLAAWLIPSVLGFLGLTAGPVLARKFLVNEELTDAQTKLIEASISGKIADVRLARARERQILEAVENPEGITREVAEDIAKRRLGLEERRAEQVIEAFEDERDFRRFNREGQELLLNERLGQVRAERGIKEAQEEELYARSLTAGERAQLELDKLVTERELQREVLQGIRETRAMAAEAARRLPPSPPIVGPRAVGPGVPSGIQLGRLFGT